MSNIKPSKLPAGELLDKKTPLNVILITLDAFGYDLFIENIDALPNLKALKSQSVFFENAFSVGPSTFFSFPAIIASVYPYHFGVGIDKNAKAIDQVLKEQGYNTAMVNELNVLLTKHFGYGMRTDYQRHILNLGEAKAHKRLKDVLLGDDDAEKAKNVLRPAFPFRRILSKLNFKWTRGFGNYVLKAYRFLKLHYGSGAGSLQRRTELYHRFRDEVFAFISESFESPQLLWIHTVINHLPYLPPDTARFRTSEVNYLNSRGLTEFANHKIAKRLKQVYIESLKTTDMFLGDVMGTLSNRGLLDESIFVITADHGEEFMEEGYFGHSPESSSDRLLHVPLMFHCPSILRPRSISVPVSTIDILPTLCDLLGIVIPNSSRGLSLKQIMLNTDEDLEEYQELHQRPLFSESWHLEGQLDRTPGYTSDQKMFTVRQGIYKLNVAQKRTKENTVIQKLELLNWVSNQKLEIRPNNQVVEHLKHMLNNHIRDEGIFASELKRDAEIQRIKDTLDKMRSN